MDFAKLYQEKKTTPQEAVKVVRSGDWVDFGWCTATADTLDQALAERYAELKDVKVRGGVIFKKPAIMQVPDTAEHFTWNSWHMSGIERKMAAERIAYYNPMRYSELPRFYRENVEPVRAAMFQVSPMDEHGYFSFGPSASHMVAVCERSEYVIVEVNENMPRCLGSSESNIHISQVDMVVEGANAAMSQLGAGATSEIDEAVAKLIVDEIPNGACLQLGIGGMPNAVGAKIAQSDLKDLGVHTEMYVDAYVDLNTAGKISCSKKNIDRFCQTYAFAAGTQKLYDFLDNNPACQATAVDYTNDVRIISQLDNFISINNIIEMDLFGQVNAETAGTRQISGAGGQLDFVMGAYLSEGGKSFVCCSSTYKNKAGELKSRIMPTLKPGSVVTDTRANVHWFVTEHGKVNLKGTSTWEKAERVISVAHPEFREELIRQADEMGIWRRSNK